MREKHPVSPLPSPETIKEAGWVAWREFSPRKIMFLDRNGQWRENPVTLRDRVSHALLFSLWSKGEKEAMAFFDQSLAPFLEEGSRPAARKIGASLLGEQEPESLERPSPFAVLFEVLLWIIQRQALQLNAEARPPDWDREACAFKSESQKKLQSLEDKLGSILAPGERTKFLEDVSRVNKAGQAVFTPLAGLISEEEKITSTLERLLQEASVHPHPEEIDPVIVEKIQPPMGVVTQTSPALFFPCLHLLLDQTIDVSSGIPHMASVVLSILRDPRSAEPLLKALELYAVRHTKIRENIIYTLGNLREGRAVDALAEVLEQADDCLLFEQKEEAIWALGKIGFEAVRAVPALVKYADHSSARLKTYLAWTLGEVGKAQKEKSGGVSADIVIALLKLLKEKNKQIFEEAVSALKKIDLPEFVHSLYLYHVGAISILGLKPAQRGLFELSETLHYLLQTKKRTILAVNGDSGTGKTYFCQSIASGFAGIGPQEILYLMRDTKSGQKIFNRLLGLKWLMRHIDPAYYQDYPLSEDEDNPEAYFEQFIQDNQDKRLIILDGCRDRHYFQKVIDFFYNRGELDVEVNFRANFSTRRLNLEERELALESVKLHLAFLEEPPLEDTAFYQEGSTILYDLDNSHASRLNREETKELFEKRRIESWGELIRIGDFSGEGKPSECRREKLSVEKEAFTFTEHGWPESRTIRFSAEEKRLKPALNEDLETEPNLLKTIPLGLRKPGQIRFYAQNQVAGTAGDGTVFVLAFLDNRVFQTAPGHIGDIALLGRTLYLAVPGRGLLGLSFERNEIVEFHEALGPPVKVASFPPDAIITAHENGLLRIWNFLEKKTTTFASGLPRVSSLAADQTGRIYAGGENGKLRQWDLERKEMKTIEHAGNAHRLLRLYPHGKILSVEHSGTQDPFSVLKIIDFEKNTIMFMPAPSRGTISGVNVFYDGRIIAGFCDPEGKGRTAERNLVILSPKEQACISIALTGHPGGTTDCLAMGPKIVSCGLEADGVSAIRIWGSELFVKRELGKLLINP